MEQKKEKKYIVGSILCGLLTALGVVATVISLIGGKRTLSDCVQLILLAFIGYYAFTGYKKPHGNLLKFVILIRAIIPLTLMPARILEGNTMFVIVDAIRTGLLCYVAGRLAKIKENLVLIVIETVCLVISLVINIGSGFATIGVASSLIVWLDICVAYFLRYKQHREAGLEDAPKGK